MKKTIVVLALFISVIISFLSFSMVRNNDEINVFNIQDYIATQENTSNHLLYITINDNKAEFVNKIVEFIKLKNISVVANVESNVEGINIKDYYVFSQNKKLFNKLKIKQEKRIDFSVMDHDYYYSSIPDQKSVGIIQTIDKNYLIDTSYVTRIHNFSNVASALQSTSLYVFCNNNDIDEIKNLIHQFGTVDDLTEGYAPAQMSAIMKEKIQQIQLLMFLFFFIIALLLIVYYFKQRRKVMIYRLNGLSRMNILKSFIPINLVICTSYVVGILGSGIYLRTSDSDYWSKIIEFSLMFILILIVTTLILFIIVSTFTSIKYLKKGSSVKGMIEETMIFKFVAIAIILPLLVNNGIESFTHLNNYLNIKLHEKEYESLLYFEQSKLDHYESTVKVFNKLVKEGIYADFSYAYQRTPKFLLEYNPEFTNDQLDEMAFQYPMIYANVNYLKNYSFINEDGKKIQLSKIKEDLLIVPKKYKNENLKLSMYSSDIKKVYVNETGTFTNPALQTPYTRSNPVIHLVTKYSDETSFDYLSLMSNKKGVKEWENEIFKEVGEIPKLKSRKKIVSSTKTYILNQLKDVALLFIMTCGVLIVLLYLNIVLYFNENGKMYVLSYLNGFPRLKRLSGLYVYSIINYSFLFVVGLFVERIEYVPLLKTLLIIMFIEFIMMNILVILFEKKNMVILLKGGIESE